MTSRGESTVPVEDFENQWLEVFSLFDAQGDGTIKSSDLGTVMMALGCLFTCNELEKIITSVDPGSKGLIDFPEFVHIMSKYPPSVGSEEELSAAITEISGKSDIVSLLKLRTNLTNFGDALTDDDIDKFYIRYGPCPADDVLIQEIAKQIVYE